jgi:hypothetical protein
MGKKAREYLRTRQAKLPSHMKRHTELAGISEAERDHKIREQRMSDENDRLINQGLVPVAVDFGVIAQQCGIDVQRHALDMDRWVPAWYLAAWQSYQDRFGDPEQVFGTPTPHYKNFIDELKRDEREKLLLVSELLLGYPNQGDLTAQGLRAWIKNHE